MSDDDGYEVVPGLVRESLRKHLAQLNALLRRNTVFFSVLDARTETMKVAGSGVVADLHGSRVVLTAGHVLRDFKRDFEEERIGLSANTSKGRFVVPRYADRFDSPGGDAGADAGVIILPPHLVDSYFEYGNFEPARVSTLRITPPEIGLDCVIGGYPANQAVTVVEIRRTHVDRELHEHQLQAPFLSLGAHMLSVDDTHYWLNAAGAPENTVTGESLTFVPGDLNGMSGCGFWSLEGKWDRSLPEPKVAESRLLLHGVHTGTDAAGARLRETPIVHHLRLLAAHKAGLREKISTLWPSVEL